MLQHWRFARDSNSAGQAVFQGLTEDAAGTYTLSATVSGAQAVPSNSFIVSPATSTARISFGSEPSNAVAGATLNPVTIQIADTYGNAIAGRTVSITSSPHSLTSGGSPLTTNSAGQVVFTS